MKERNLGRNTPPLSPEQLLPISPIKARHIALKAHLALASLRQGFGTVGTAGEVLKTLYITYLLSNAEVIRLRIEDFASAEKGLKMAVEVAAQTGSCALEKGYWPAVGSVLALHDRQLGRLPLYRREKAYSELRDLAAGPGLPNLVLSQRRILNESAVANETPK